MSRRRSKRFTGPDGLEYVPVSLTTARAFAAACLEVWSKRDGVERRWMLDNADHVDVPVTVLEEARAKLPARPKAKVAA